MIGGMDSSLLGSSERRYHIVGLLGTLSKISYRGGSSLCRDNHQKRFVSCNDCSSCGIIFFLWEVSSCLYGERA